MAKTKPALVVADAGPLIHLDELAALDVLSDYAEVFVPNAVWLEVQNHRPQALQQTSVNLVRQPSPPASARINAMTAMYTLHHGEREALSLCLDHAVDVLLTDDTAARLAAKTLNITTHGTLGLLIRAVRQHLRTPSEVLALLTAVPQQTTLHIRPSLLNEIVTRVKTEWESGL
jgi:predicted nucleic acid-binding protein